jgi:nicotinamidase-related amidase
MQGAKGTGIDKKVHLVSDDVYIKSKMNALTNKRFLQFLNENFISELYIAGLFAEACVKRTVKGGIKNQYKAVVIEDAVGSKVASKKSQSGSFYKDKGSRVITADQLEQDCDISTLYRE